MKMFVLTLCCIWTKRGKDCVAWFRTHNFSVWPKLEIDKNFTVCHYNFTPPKVLTWTTSPKGGKNWVLVSYHQKTFIVYHNLMCSQSICQSTHKCIWLLYRNFFYGGAIIVQISNVMKIAT